MSATQRRKMKKLRKSQCEVLELACQLVGIKVIYTKRDHVRLLWAEHDELTRYELYFRKAGLMTAEVPVGKKAFEMMDAMLVGQNFQKLMR